MPSPSASRRNLALAKAKWRPPRPWRSLTESRCVKSLVWQWLRRPPEERCSARKLARLLGVSHTWVNFLRRRFECDPEKQAQQEALWDTATIEQLRDEQGQRKWDFVRYRPRRIQRPLRPDPLRDKLERQVKTLLKRQRNWEHDYRSLDGFGEYNARRLR